MPNFANLSGHYCDPFMLIAKKKKSLSLHTNPPEITPIVLERLSLAVRICKYKSVLRLRDRTKLFGEKKNPHEYASVKSCYLSMQ